MEVHFLSKIFISVALIGVIGLIFRLYDAVVAQPRRLRSALQKQGLSGPPPTFLLGNILDVKKAREAASKAATINGPPSSHNCGAAILPFFDEWRKQFGDVFLFSLGNTKIVHVTQPEMVREITTCTWLDLGKPTYQAKERGSLLGQGILTSNGSQWIHQRKILAPELNLDKVKASSDDEQPGGVDARERDQETDSKRSEGKKRSRVQKGPAANGAGRSSKQRPEPRCPRWVHRGQLQEHILGRV